MRCKFVEKNCSLVLLLSLFASSSLADAPQIANISGSVVHGSQTTITGQFFGSKTPAAPRYWADFESGTGLSSFSLSQSWTSESPLEHTNVNERRRSTGAIRSDVAAAGGAVPYVENMNSERWYMFVKRYYALDIIADKGPNGFNLKVNRMWAGFAADNHNNIYVNWQGDDGWGSGRAFNEYTSVSGGAQWFHNILFTPNQWVTDEIVYAASDVGVQNGIFDYFRDGTPAWNDRQWQTRTQSLPNAYNMFFFDQVSNGTGPGPLWIYYDDIYMDDTWARVMVCDSPFWSRCQKKEIQIPTSWTDNQIEFIVNLGDLDVNTQSGYLYVVTSEGLVNAQGTLLYPCQRCPSPPEQLGAQ